MVNFNKKKFLSWVPVLLWMLIIFSLSAQPAMESNGLSKNVTKIIIEIIGKIIPFDIESSTAMDLVSQFNHIVRKFAHFSAYLVLGVLVINAFRKCGINGYKLFVFSIIFCVIYASSDEIHQLFVPGRGCQLKDVIIDSMGALTGIVIYEILSIFVNRGKDFKM